MKKSAALKNNLPEIRDVIRKLRRFSFYQYVGYSQLMYDRCFSERDCVLLQMTHFQTRAARFRILAIPKMEDIWYMGGSGGYLSISYTEVKKHLREVPFEDLPLFVGGHCTKHMSCVLGV